MLVVIDLAVGFCDGIELGLPDSLTIVFFDGIGLGLADGLAVFFFNGIGIGKAVSTEFPFGLETLVVLLISFVTTCRLPFLNEPITRSKETTVSE